MLKRGVLPVVLLLLYRVGFSKSSNLTNVDLDEYNELLAGQGLYSAKDHILVLNGSNFKSEAYGKPYAILIEFYSSWCGFCQRFSPTWKALAAYTKDWKDVIVIGAVDCYESINIPICRDFEIEGTPTIRYFHENFKEGADNIGTNVETGIDLKTLKKELVLRIIQEQHDNRAKQFPKLLPYTSSSKDYLTEGLPADTKYVFGVLENPNSLFGPELAIILRKIPTVFVKYALSNNTELIKDLGVGKLPALMALHLNSKKNLMVESLKSVRNILKKIKGFLLPEDEIELPEIVKSNDIFTGNWLNTTAAPEMQELKKEREFRLALKELGDVVFQEDLETSIRYSFQNEVAAVKKISDERLDALKKYVNILVKYFPFGKEGKEFLGELKKKTDSGEVSISGADIGGWLDNAESKENKVFYSPPKFIACKGSSSRYRGYSCTLWKLFHYLTVNAALKNEGNKDAYPREILDAMLAYVKHFFKCSDCSKHFQAMAKDHQIDKVDSLDNAVLWLWTAHNAANKRLAGDVVEDPEFPKIQFPSPANCPSCRDPKMKWSSDGVLKYLKKMYNEDGILHVKKGKIVPWKVPSR